LTFALAPNNHGIKPGTVNLLAALGELSQIRPSQILERGTETGMHLFQLFLICNDVQDHILPPPVWIEAPSAHVEPPLMLHENTSCRPKFPGWGIHHGNARKQGLGPFAVSVTAEVVNAVGTLGMVLAADRLPRL
jgi:hypothetical protein